MLTGLVHPDTPFWFCSVVWHGFVMAQCCRSKTIGAVSC
jgi:hypothetical protein